MANIQILQGADEIGPFATRQWIVFGIDFLVRSAVVSSNAHPLEFNQSLFAERKMEVFETIGQVANSDGSRRVFVNVRSLSEETMNYVINITIITA
jgi:hypothetical protein